MNNALRNEKLHVNVRSGRTGKTLKTQRLLFKLKSENFHSPVFCFILCWLPSSSRCKMGARSSAMDMRLDVFVLVTPMIGHVV